MARAVLRFGCGKWRTMSPSRPGLNKAGSIESMRLLAMKSFARWHDFYDSGVHNLLLHHSRTGWECQ